MHHDGTEEAPATGEVSSGFSEPMPTAAPSASDAAHAQAIGAVGCHFDIDHGIVETHRLGVGRTGLEPRGKFDDAFAVVRDFIS